MAGVFVTGTDTEVGKTVASSLLVATLRRYGPVGYWKPVQTGIEEDDDTAEVRRLAACSDDEILDQGVRLPRPLSPHLSARLAGKEIDVDSLARLGLALAKDRFWVVEGAGGLLVPLNGSKLLADLIAVLELPTLIAARCGLGTINHTLLTIAELRRRSIPVAGVVMMGKPNPENRAAIEFCGKTEVLAEIPVLCPLDADSIAKVANESASRLAILRAAIGGLPPGSEV